MSLVTGKYNEIPLSWIKVFSILAFLIVPVVTYMGAPLTGLMFFNLGLYLNLVILIRERIR